MPEYSFYCKGCTHEWSVVCGMTNYTDKQACPSCKKRKSVFRDFEKDVSTVYGSINLSLSEVKTLGHYADKQSKKYGKWKCEDMKENFKTKKTEEGKDLPAGMSRMETPAETPVWPGTKKKKKRRKTNG